MVDVDAKADASFVVRPALNVGFAAAWAVLATGLTEAGGYDAAIFY